MKIPSALHGRRSELKIELTPMIDCVFLLMVYFIWTSSFAIVEDVLPGHMSAVAGASSVPTNQPPPPEADFDNIVVRVILEDGSSRWTVNDSPVTTVQQLAAQLRAIAGIKQDVPVILHPDPEVELGDVIEAYDLARQAGFERIQFAASQGMK